ncbi:YbaB/EbfC family nucleoid-associated protein [Mycobacterium syngnathidarum]
MNCVIGTGLGESKCSVAERVRARVVHLDHLLSIAAGGPESAISSAHSSDGRVVASVDAYGHLLGLRIAPSVAKDSSAAMLESAINEAIGAAVDIALTMQRRPR